MAYDPDSKLKYFDLDRAKILSTEDALNFIKVVKKLLPGVESVLIKTAHENHKLENEQERRKSLYSMPEKPEEGTVAEEPVKKEDKPVVQEDIEAKRINQMKKATGKVITGETEEKKAEEEVAEQPVKSIRKKKD